MVVKDLIKMDALRVCTCPHCKEVLIEEAYQQWFGIEDVESDSMSVEEVENLKLTMQNDNLAWKNEADVAWEVRMGEFLLAHSGCGLPIADPTLLAELKEEHTQTVVIEKETTNQSQNISQEDTKMDENTNKKPEEASEQNVFQNAYDKTNAFIDKYIPKWVRKTVKYGTVLAVGIAVENKFNLVDKGAEKFGRTKAPVNVKKTK